MVFRLLGISGSPKKPSEKTNSSFLLKIALESAKQEGLAVTQIALSDYSILQCTGCEICTTKPCPLDKDDD